MRSEFFKLKLVVLASLFVSVGWFSPATAQFNSADSYTNDTQPIVIDGSFEPLGDGLAGDSIEHDRGTLSLYHVDVDLPGNSALPVRFARSYMVHGTTHTGNHLGGWQMDVPYLTTRMRLTANSPGANGPAITAAGGCFLNGLDRGEANPDDAAIYYQGFQMRIPGEGMKTIVEIPTDSKAARFPWTSQHTTTATTTDHWKVYCEGNGTGYNIAVIAVSPEGTKYEFRKLSLTAAGPEAISVFAGTRRTETVSRVDLTWHHNLLATRVTDVHGNWVEYDYEKEFDYTFLYGQSFPTFGSYSSHRLIAIRGNDGREITLQYNGMNNPGAGTTPQPYVQLPEEGMTTTVASVTANGRTWTYQYAQPGDANYVSVTSFKNLRRVVLPDGTDWVLNLPIQHHRAHRAYNSFKCTTVDQGYTSPQAGVMFWVNDIYVKHPSGARIDFDFQLIKNAIWKLGTLTTITNEIGCRNPDPEFIISNAVVQKTITAPQALPATWQFSYVPTAYTEAGVGDVKRRVETRPDGSTVTRLITINKEGDEVKKTIAGTGVNYVEQTQYTKLNEFAVWGDYTGILSRAERYKDPSLKRATDIATTTEGSLFRTVNLFNNTLSSSSYSYGSPIKVTETGTGPGSRITDVTYAHDLDDWVLGLPDTITKNGKLFDDLNYDSKGRVTEHWKFGSKAADITYFTSGTAAGRVNTITDAIGRSHVLTNFKRGIPQNIAFPDATAISRVVDNNGWVTSQTDGRGITTQYQYNNVGWLTLIDRPSPWADTTLTYGNLGNGLTQTSTRGGARTVTTFDGYFRPILIKSEDLANGSSPIFTKYAYDGLSRVTFTSFPSFSSNPVSGANSTYDALGRVITLAENVAPFATTSTAYLSGDCVRTTDPVGAQTTQCAEGYGRPGKGNIVSIAQPEGITTAMTYDIYGYLTAATQSGGGKSFTQNWAYDARLRPCAFTAPETGKSLYAYDNADQLTEYAEGLTGAAACATLPADKTVLTYDAMGRPLTTNYPGAAPDIIRTYNANGSPLTVNRGGINWTYAYHPSADLPVSASLTVDSRTYPQTYSYNPEQVLTNYTLPSGKAVVHGVDGLGRVTGVTLDGAVIASGMSYHPNGALAGMTYGNGQVFSQTQTVRQMPLRLRSVKAAEVPVDLTYAYTARGQVSSIDDQSPANIDQTFTYDGAARLTASTGPWGAGTFTYDAIGNLVQRQVGARTAAMSYNATSNRLTSHTDTVGGPRSLGYDTRGNVTALGGLGFIYDASNQPVAVSGSAAGTYAYDGHLRRVKQIVSGETRYSVYDVSGGLVSIDQIGAGPTEYIRASGMTLARVAGAAVTWLHPDHLGSAVAGTGSTGSVVWRESKQPFGEDWISAPANDNQPGYTGHVEDAATGLIYMQARYYDPVIGRFLANDPVGFSPQRPDNFNRYAYAANDPVNAVDPFGTESYFIARPIKKFGFTVAYHGFVVVTAEGTGRSGNVVARYSFGPDTQTGATLVNLTGVQSETNTQDLQYLADFQSGKDAELGWVEIDATNDQTIAAGASVIGHPNYSILPNNEGATYTEFHGEFGSTTLTGGGSANSNSAAVAIASAAAKANGRSFNLPSLPIPSPGGLSGANQANEVLRACPGSRIRSTEC